MNEADAEVGVRGRVGLGFTVVAAAISALVMSILIYLNVSAMHKFLSTRSSTTEPPPSGLLTGRYAVGGSEWVPRVDQERNVVLFSLSRVDGHGGMEFWGDVSSRVIEASPNTEFVALCVRDEACGSLLHQESAITILDAMDPLYMHAMAEANRRSQALVFRGSIMKVIPIRDDKQAMSADILSIFDNEDSERRL